MEQEGKFLIKLGNKYLKTLQPHDDDHVTSDRDEAARFDLQAAVWWIENGTPGCLVIERVE